MTDMGRPKSVWHDLPPRMSARVLASGKVLFYYQAAGKKKPLGSDRIEANRKWTEYEAGAVSQAFPAIAKLYRAAVFRGLAKSTAAHYEIALRNLEKYLEKVRLEQIQPAHVKSYIRKRSKKAAAFFEKRVLSAVFNWARGEGLTSAPNPCLGVTFSKAERKGFGTGKRVRYVTDEEYAEVHARGDTILQDAMDLALLTGQRPSDLLSLTRQHIRDGVLWIVQAKTGATVGIRVEAELARVLERIQARPRPVPSMFLICDRKGQRVRYNALHERFRKALGDGDWQFRDLRAKAATDSPNLKDAQLLLGHATETTTAGVYRRSKGSAVAPLKR
jgi:integrase